MERLSSLLVYVMTEFYSYTKVYTRERGWEAMNAVISEDVQWLAARLGRSGNFSGDPNTRWSYLDSDHGLMSYFRVYYFTHVEDYAEFTLCRGNI